MEKKDKTAIQAINLSSAYDLVDHKILTEKCRMLGLGKLTMKWLEDYLSKRQQYVEVNGEKSTVLDIGENGVIQGAPSSGDLFLYFLNNLPDMGKKEEMENTSTVQKLTPSDIDFNSEPTS